MIAATDLIAKFRSAYMGRFGYIYGKRYELWTEEKQESYRREYLANPEKYEDRQLSAEKGGKWVGHYVTDCSGLFAWSADQLGGYFPHGSNSIWSGYCTKRGTLNSGKRTDKKELLPGTAVFTSTGDRHNHIGLYVGDRTVIEAQGTEAGVTTSRITNKKWTHWGELKGVLYDSQNDQKVQVVVNLEQTKVTKGNLRLRMSPSTDASVLKMIPNGSIVNVLSKGDVWWNVSYDGKSGYVMAAYLQEYTAEMSNKESIVITLPMDAATELHDALEKALKK